MSEPASCTSMYTLPVAFTPHAPQSLPLESAPRPRALASPREVPFGCTYPAMPSVFSAMSEPWMRMRVVRFSDARDSALTPAPRPPARALL